VVTASLFAYIVLVGFFLTLLRAARNGDRIHRTVRNKWQPSSASSFERRRYPRPRHSVAFHHR
jgi:hypothetical protein